jgi:hypothetical protein
MMSAKQNKWRLPPWLIGAVLADSLWGLAWFVAYASDTYERLFPVWLRRLDVPDTVGSICALIAAPVPLGGWLLIWGDNGPPYVWIETVAFNVSFGLCFYALLGALAGLAVERMRAGRTRESV